MDIYKFKRNVNSSTMKKNDDETVIVSNGNYNLEFRSAQDVNIFRINKVSSNQTKETIDVDVDQVYINDALVSPATAEDLYILLDTAGIFFLDEDGDNVQDGFIDYNDTTGAFLIVADTWTDLPNDGLGAFTNKNYPPTGVSELIDTSTGYIDVTELNLGDTILVRNDYTVNPNTNNAQLRFRYELGNGGGLYTLEKIIGRLDSGSGQNYRFSLTPDLIYMGDSNTRDNPIKLQVYCTSNATVTNAGSVITVVKR
jgi:hypothetical protein